MASLRNQIMSFIVLSLVVATTLLNNLLPGLNYVYFSRHGICHDGFSLSLTFTVLLLSLYFTAQFNFLLIYSFTDSRKWLQEVRQSRRHKPSTQTRKFLTLDESARNGKSCG